MEETLFDLLHKCSARIELVGKHGTGFFVAPGLILTCAHVIEGAQSDPSAIKVHYAEGEQFVQEVMAFLPAPYPDLALLRVEQATHPCVYLDKAAAPFDTLYSYGYTLHHPEGESITLQCEGWVGADTEQRLLKLKQGQVVPGSSGAPVLDIRTGSVCGMMKLTRDRLTDLGGGAIPTSVIFTRIPSLEDANEAFHQLDTRWAEARQRRGEPDTTISPASAVLYTEPGVLDKPPHLFGREELLSKAHALLDESRRVLLVGFAGSGKTALAATIADQRTAAGKGATLWLRSRFIATDRHLREAAISALFEALGECLGRKEVILDQRGDARLIALRQLLAESNVGLLVFDDARDGAALYELLRVIPQQIPVLVTSRQSFALETIEVEDLAPAAALSLLSYHARKDYSGDVNATKLSELLGYHAFALEIAGKRLKEDRRVPRDLLRRLASAPHQLAESSNYAPIGRESLTALLNDSYDALSANAKEAFLAFGVLSAPGASVELLEIYLTGRLTLRVQGILEPLHNRVFDALDELVRRSLAKRRDDSDFYFVHDLTFSYTRALFDVQHRERQEFVAAVESFLTNNARDYDILALDLSNILGAANTIDGEQLVRMVSILTIGSFPIPQGHSYLDERGHTLALLEQLDRAIVAAQTLEPALHTTLHYILGKRGNAYYERGDIEHALQTYKAALALAPNNNRQIKLLSAIGKMLAEQGDNRQADEYLVQADNLARSNKDDDALSFVLEFRSYCAGQRGDYEAAGQFADEAIEINRRLGDPVRLGFSLLNKAAAEHFRGNIDKALSINLEALSVARTEGHLSLVAGVLESLAENYDALGFRDQAQQCCDEVLQISKQIGDTVQEADILAFMEKHGYATPR